MRALIAVDLKHEPGRVVDDAAAWCVRLGATADVMYAAVYEPMRSWVEHPQLGAIVASELLRYADEDRKALSDLLDRIPAPNRGCVHLIEGNAVQIIAARAQDYDLVIVGTHARSGLMHLILGSVADSIVRGSMKPVLVVRGRPPEGTMAAL